MGLGKVACFLLASLGLAGCGDSQQSSSLIDPSSKHQAIEPVSTPATVSSFSDVQHAAPNTEHSPETKSEAVTGIAAELIKTHKPRNAIEAARNSTVFIDSGFGSGSGFFIDSSCTVVTNRHVVQMTYDDMKKMERRRLDVRRYLERGIANRDQRRQLRDELEELDEAVLAYKPSGAAKEITLSLVNGRKLHAKVKAFSREWDLAYLHIAEEGCDPFIADESKDLPLGHRVYTIGNPAGMKYSVTSGIISGYQEYQKKNYIQTDAAINGGNSGGPLIDSEGRLLGVNSWVLTNTEGIGFAIPAHVMLADMANLKNKMNDALVSAEFELWDPKAVSDKEDEKKRLALMTRKSLRDCVTEFDDKQWVVALEECRFAAENDEAQAQYLLSELIYDKEDPEKLKESMEWLKKSAHQGYAEAVYRLARFYEKGEGVAKNPAVAADMYEEACEKNLPWACNSLAVDKLRKFETDGVRELLDKAIANGSVTAIYNLGFMYDRGLGVEKNLARADKLFEEAAMLGFNIAHYRMFWKNYKGRNQKKDYTKAYAWLLVCETYNKEEADVIKGWSSDIPADTRFFLKRLLSNDQLTIAYSQAGTLKREIARDAEAHKKAHLYGRKELLEESNNIQARADY